MIEDHLWPESRGFLSLPCRQIGLQMLLLLVLLSTWAMSSEVNRGRSPVLSHNVNSKLCRISLLVSYKKMLRVSVLRLYWGGLSVAGHLS